MDSHPLFAGKVAFQDIMKFICIPKATLMILRNVQGAFQGVADGGGCP